MKLKVILTLICITNSLFSNVELLINNYHPYKGEVASIMLTGPVSDDVNSYTLGIDESDYTIVKDMEIITDDEIKFMLKLVFHSPGSKYFTPTVNNFGGIKKTLYVEELDGSKTLPFAKVNLSKEWAFTGELVLYRIDLFADNFIGDIEFNQDPMNISYYKLNNGVNNNFYFQNKSMGKVKRVVTYGLYNDTQGVFQVPGGTINYRGKSIVTEPVELEVFKLPSDITSEHILGDDLEIEIGGINRRYHYNSKIEFTVTVKGPANLAKLESLKKYSKQLKHYKEKIVKDETTVINDFIIQEKVFKYTGFVSGLTGIETPYIEIPFFNTTTYDNSNIILESEKTKGSFNIVFLIITIIFILVLLFYMVVIVVKWLKVDKYGKKADLKEFYEDYNLSNREKDILKLLITGKSNKDIATDLNISPETVKKHIQNILKKSNKNSRIELIAEISSKI